MSEKVDQVIEDLKQKAEEAIDKADQKLEAEKDEWAKLAATDPDAARRQVRSFWICVAGGLGVVLGYALHALIALL